MRVARLAFAQPARVTGSPIRPGNGHSSGRPRNSQNAAPRYSGNAERICVGMTRGRLEIQTLLSRMRE
jgi:hypothetical protein